MDVGAVQMAAMPSEVGGLASKEHGESGFVDLLRSAIAQVNQAQNGADNAAREFAIGEAKSIHDTMITLEKADLSLRLMMQVRNKVVEAYQEVMRMQI
jgi:flagellar hook-basal body complex protein FliE